MLAGPYTWGRPAAGGRPAGGSPVPPRNREIVAREFPDYDRIRGMTETPVENTAAVTPRKRKSPAVAAGENGAAVTTAEDIVSRLEVVTVRLAQLEELVAVSVADSIRRTEHIDLMVHAAAQGVTRLTELLDRHAPLLERAAALMDPGSRLRGLTGRGRRG